MKISVISTVLNEEKNISQFMKSILNQSKKPDEIIIVDGGSKDKTFEILREFSQKNKLFAVFQEKGANISRGRNIAIKKAKGDILIVADAGCVVDKDWIKNTIAYFPEADVVAGNYKAITKNNFEYFQSLLVVKSVDRPSRMSSRNISFKKECWKSVGGYPEDFLTGEDTKFNLMFQRAGYKIKINPKQDVSWEMRPTLKKFARQFYLYGKGDRKHGNLIEMKKNLAMVSGFWIYFVLLILAAIFNLKAFLVLLDLPVFVLFVFGIKYSIKTKKISALFWMPLLLFVKRVSYILGAS